MEQEDKKRMPKGTVRKSKGRTDEVYFNASAKLHLREYLESRTDDCPALFVQQKAPYNRLSISRVESTLRRLGKCANINKVHPHRFRRTMATEAINRGMPIEQVQRLLGHAKIDTTMRYAHVVAKQKIEAMDVLDKYCA